MLSLTGRGLGPDHQPFDERGGEALRPLVRRKRDSCTSNFCLRGTIIAGPSGFENSPASLLGSINNVVQSVSVLLAN
jgi:hypothetical protein